MLPRNIILFVFLLFSASSGMGLRAQSVSTAVCPNSANLICTLAGVYGPNGLQQGIGPLESGKKTNPPTNHQGGHFETSFINNFGPLNSAVGSQLTLLPLGSPGSGLVFVYDPSLKTFTTSTEDLGPILTERANTTGRHKISFGFNYQRFSFSTIDDANLHSLPASFVHIDDAGQNNTPDSTNGVQLPPGTTCSTNNEVTGPGNTGLCGFVRDRIDTMTNINLVLNQYTATATFGLTKRLDISLVVPIINVGMNVSSVATIVDNSNTGDHQFNPAFNASPAKGPNCSGTPPCFQGIFANSNSATGIGDVVVRAKDVIWNGERAAVAVGADIRFPTGDAQNYLGSGTYGFTPFAVFSYAARVSPHATVGFQENGNSVLAGDIVTPTSTTPSSFKSGHLPNQFLYSGGADLLIVRKRLAGTFDLIGQRVLNARRAIVSDQSFLGACGPAGLQPVDSNNSNGYCTSPATNTSQAALTGTKGSYDILNAALGAKVRLTDRLVIFGNVLIKLNNGGLRATVAPLVGTSLNF